MSVGGWRRECWLGSRRAGLSLPIPHPLLLPPETPSYGHTSPLAVLHVCPASLQAFPHSVPSTCSILFPILTRPAQAQAQAQAIRLSSGALPPCCPLHLQQEEPPLCSSGSPAPLAAPLTSLGFTWALHHPGPVLILLLWMGPGEARSWPRADVGSACLLRGELRVHVGFRLQGGVDSAILREAEKTWSLSLRAGASLKPLTNPQPVFFSFETEPPSPDFQVTS